MFIYIYTQWFWELGVSVFYQNVNETAPEIVEMPEQVWLLASVFFDGGAYIPGTVEMRCRFFNLLGHIPEMTKIQTKPGRMEKGMNKKVVQLFLSKIDLQEE